MPPVNEYYQQKELIYAAQKKCRDLYNLYSAAKLDWEEACRELYALERKANELSEKMFDNATKL